MLVYYPSIIPGHHLPHCRLQKDGQMIAIRDLIPLDRLVLFSDSAVLQNLIDERVEYVQIRE